MKKIFSSLMVLIVLAGCSGQSDTANQETPEQTLVDTLLVQAESFSVKRLPEWKVMSQRNDSGRIELRLPDEKQESFAGRIEVSLMVHKTLDNVLEDYRPGRRYADMFTIRPEEVKLGELAFTVLEREGNNLLFAQLPGAKRVLKVELSGMLVDDPDVQRILGSFSAK